MHSFRSSLSQISPFSCKGNDDADNMALPRRIIMEPLSRGSLFQLFPMTGIGIQAG